MYPEPDQRADQFDEALDRLLAGETPPEDENDPEIRQLLHLARRLDNVLPKDLPDPQFRNKLKQDLIIGSSEHLTPVDLDEERWHRRATRSTWRLGTVAAAFVVVGAAAILLGLNQLIGDDEEQQLDDDRAFIQSFGDQQSDTSDPPEIDDVPSDATLSIGTADQPDESTSWGDLPPLDTNHIVLNPAIGIPLTLATSERTPEIEFASDMDPVDMPDSATVYYLSAPPDAVALLTSLQQRLGVDGTLEPGSVADGTPYRLLNGTGDPIFEWEPSSAWFRYSGDATTDAWPNDPDLYENPIDIATGFLETIGFDLYTIEYQPTVEDEGSYLHVHFQPTSLPATGLDIDLGATVRLSQEGVVEEAQLMWLSLIDQREIDLRETREAIEMGKEGHGFWPPFQEAENGARVHFVDAMMIYLLTRYDDTTFVLQPAMKFIGQFDDADQPGDEPHARYYVAAVNANDN